MKKKTAFVALTACLHSLPLIWWIDKKKRIFREMLQMINMYIGDGNHNKNNNEENVN